MKYLDNSGLQYFWGALKPKLAAKQDKLVSGTNIKTINNQSILGSGNITIDGGGGGSASLPVLGETFRIWDLEPGIYVTGTDSWDCYYYGATNTSNILYGAGKNALVVIYEQINAADVVYKMFMIFGGTAGNRYCYHGYARETSGESKSFSFTKNYLTSISSYVKNNLNYSTSSSSYALSAYQGYLIGQRLAALEACPYEVGDLYITTSTTDPNTKWEGTTWEQVKDTFLLACGDTYAAGTSGGEAQHTLTVAEMPWHEHPEAWNGGDGNKNPLVTTTNIGTATTGGTYFYGQHAYYQWSNPKWWMNTYGTGGSGAHNNMPPYIAVYVWKRTA